MVYSDMQNKTKSNFIKNKDCVLYAKAHIFPVGHENYGKRLFIDRGSLAYLEAKAAMARLKSSAVGFVSSKYWTDAMGEELPQKEINSVTIDGKES